MADRVAIIRAGRVEQLGTPTELYRRPRDTFVAEFLGETNFIEGEASRSNGAVRVRTPAGELVALPHEHAPESGDVVCSIRPESIRIVEPGASSNAQVTIEGKRLETTYLGETAQHLVELPGGVRVKIAELNPAPAHLDPANSDVTLTINPEDIVVLPTR